MRILLAILIGLCCTANGAESKVAVLEFEFKDFASSSGEFSQNAFSVSLKPKLETHLKQYSYISLVRIPEGQQYASEKGNGYLYQHPELVADFASEYGADWVVVGRLTRPSFLFSYLKARLVNVKTGWVSDERIVEIKGQQAKIVDRGLRKLSQQLIRTINLKS